MGNKRVGWDGTNGLLIIMSGRRIPAARTPTPDLAMPYEAPKQHREIAIAQPIAPKKGCYGY